MLQHSVTSPAGGDSVFSRAWSDVSQVNPERDKISNFDGNKFIIQNLKFYRQQYEQAFRFREPHPTNQIICNNIDEGDVLSQQYLQRVIADSSVPVVEPLQTTSGGKSIKQESTTAVPDYELKSLWAPRNILSVFQFSSASNADDDEEYQYYRDRALAYVGITPTVTTLQTCPGKSYLDSQFSYASDAEDDEAEYQYYRHRALGLSPRPLSEQNITDTRGSRLGFAPFSPSSIGCSAEASTAFIPAPVSIPLDGAPASSAQGFRFGECNAEYNPMLSLARRHSNVWKCHLVGFGNVTQQQHCRKVHLSLETLSQTTLGDSGIINLLEKLLTLLQIQGCFPLGFSHQYEYQQDLPDKVLFVEGD